MRNEVDAPPPDPEGKAAELLAESPAPKGGGRRRGRPKGSKTKARAVTAEAVTVEPGPPTEAEIQAMAVFLGVLWDLIGVRVARLSKLDDEERRQLGTAAVPVARKYSHLLGGFEAEIGFAVILGGLVINHLPKPPEPGELREVNGDESPY